MKSISNVYLHIGGPIQAAITKNLNHVVMYFWDNLDADKRCMLSRTQDEFGMIPLSVAIVNKNDQMVDVFIQKPYEVTMSVNMKMTPFMHACYINNNDWIQKIYERINLDEINQVDVKGNSVITITAANQNIECSNLLFIKGAYVNKINIDSFGIIETFRELLKNHEIFIEQAEINYNEACKVYDACCEELNYYHEKASNLSTFSEKSFIFLKKSTFVDFNIFWEALRRDLIGSLLKSEILIPSMLICS